ncbi:histidine phosphatase family protein [Pseudooceanicola sp.]|uniref:histidine phosphatase family protein n=1 Tax=Pseudooceanicola sp. TaxID=1914328 RepID=UPI002621B8FA|nr:histidine phosphatase family protein [Pseudooceanicola sp.]MDF1855375.1 histidine phosphatase family protein [Pseudooceanicola sp.]
MSSLFLVRHGQASFGAADYDVLSPTGHKQAEAVGRALAAQGVKPAAFIMGDMRRHRETMAGILKGMGLSEVEPEVHPGLNEYDFGALNAAKLRAAGLDPATPIDRRTYFRTLRDVVQEWHRDEIPNPYETYGAFRDRVEAARKFIMRDGVETVLAVSSGGAIGQMIARALDAPPITQVKLQLQMKNCAVNRFVYSTRNMYLHGFNETPHIDASNEANMLTYS